MRQLEVNAEARAFDTFGVIKEEFLFGRRALLGTGAVQIKRCRRDAFDLVPTKGGGIADPNFSPFLSTTSA